MPRRRSTRRSMQKNQEEEGEDGSGKENKDEVERSRSRLGAKAEDAEMKAEDERVKAEAATNAKSAGHFDAESAEFMTDLCERVYSMSKETYNLGSYAQRSPILVCGQDGIAKRSAGIMRSKGVKVVDRSSVNLSKSSMELSYRTAVNAQPCVFLLSHAEVLTKEMLNELASTMILAREQRHKVFFLLTSENPTQISKTADKWYGTKYLEGIESVNPQERI